MFFILQHFKNSITYSIISSMPGFCILTILVAFTTTTGKLEGGVNVFACDLTGKNGNAGFTRFFLINNLEDFVRYHYNRALPFLHKGSLETGYITRLVQYL